MDDVIPKICSFFDVCEKAVDSSRVSHKRHFLCVNTANYNKNVFSVRVPIQIKNDFIKQDRLEKFAKDFLLLKQLQLV